MGLQNTVKKPKVERDRFTEDGVRLFNASKEHGVIYCDGFMEAKYIQEYEGEAVQYRGDGAPIGYTKGVPMPKKAEELLSENEALQARIKDLETSQQKTNELLARLAAQLEAKETPKAPTPAAPPKAEAPARGGSQPKP
jgi:hypothetical protein